MIHFFDFGGDLVRLDTILSLSLDRFDKSITLGTEKEDYHLTFTELEKAVASFELHKQKLLVFAETCSRFSQTPSP